MSPLKLWVCSGLLLAGLPALSIAKAIDCDPALIPTPRSYPAWVLAALSQSSDAQAAVVGDSIAAYWPQPSLEHLFGVPVLNLGYPQDEAGNVLWRLSLIKRTEPWRTVLLVVGVNSAWKSRTCDVAAGIERVVEALHEIAPLAKIIVLSVMPHGPELAASLPFVDPINAQLTRDAAFGKFIVADPSGAFLAVCEDKLTCPLLKHWLHPTDSGYTIISATVMKVLKAIVTTTAVEGPARHPR